MPSGPRLSIERIVGHERMPGARKAYIDQFLAVYGNDPFMVRLLIESGRFLVFQLSTLLHAAQEPARRETWFTLGRLKQVIAQYGLGSPRQIDHLVARLCAVGFLESRPSEQDRRLRILRPTDSLLAHDRAWLVAHYAPLAYLFPDHDYGHVMRGDPDFQIVHRRVGMAFLPMGMKVLQSAPELMLFFNRAGGVLVLAALLKAAMEEPAGAPAALSYGEIGDRFGVSRTHVRQMLEGAQSAGLMKVSGRGGRSVEVLPPMWSSYDRALAGGMQIHDMIHVAALREIGAPASDGA
jgi:DNA-binding MarR family transcriptional regulator